MRTVRSSLLPALFLVAACAPAGKGVLALEGATLIDGSGGPPIADALVLIRDGRVTAVARVNELRMPRGATVVNLAGKTIIPGLIDAHAHVERWAAPRYLAWGVTTVRDLHGQTDSALALRNAFNQGAILGPRMFTAGAMIDAAPATYRDAAAVSDPGQARRAVDQHALAGTDYVKLYTRITPDLLRATLDEAKSLRLPVAVHLGRTDALTAARAGVVSIEHLAGVVQAAARNPGPVLRAHATFLTGWTAEEQAWARLDSAAVARTAKTLAATHVTIVPTLALHDLYARLNDPALLQRPAMADVPSDPRNVVRSVGSLLRRTRWRPTDFAAFRRSRARQNQFVREYQRAGGAIAAGSDAANQLLIPGASLHEELTQLVAAGLTPIEAITAATRRGAQLLGADSLGMIAPGKLADLVVLNANPTDDIAATRDIAWVLIRGRRVQPDSLRAAWPR